MTIYDIAKEANVSASSVSRVINGKPGVNEETRKQILGLLEKYHYTPNEAARGLVKQSSRLIGILIADIRNLHHMEGAYYIQSELERHGYCGILLNTGAETSSQAAALQNLEQRRVEGAVLMGSIFQQEELASYIRQYLSKIPIIMINGRLDLPNCYSVVADEKSGITYCVDYLVNRGRRNIAYITNALTPSNKLKQDGFIEGITERKKEGTVGWVYKEELGDSLQGGRNAMQRILDEHPEVDAIIGAIDLLAAGAQQLLLERGIDIPGKVSVIGVDNSLYGEICYPRLTSLDNQIFASCVIGARQLLDSLAGGRPTPCVWLQADLVERDSA